MTSDAAPPAETQLDPEVVDDQAQAHSPEPADDPAAAPADPDDDAVVQPADPDDEAVAQPVEPDPEALRRRTEALRYVRKLGDPALRAKAIPVDRFDDDLLAEVDRMGELMDAAMGVGLAATQLGVLHRVLVYRVEHDSPVVALVNPTVEWAGREQETVEEGCLSLPGVLVDVERAVHLRVGARNERGEPITVEASGLEARVIAHEMDHLDGVLILDRTSREQRREAMRRMRETQAAD
ncbi:MAG: peptide deformylase [Solirubrobacteraceae bacterium]|jgi:peptide deformylase|nr:peptide deformylase [Solirubrobacteraceae bacterium]